MFVGGQTWTFSFKNIKNFEQNRAEPTKNPQAYLPNKIRKKFVGETNSESSCLLL